MKPASRCERTWLPLLVIALLSMPGVSPLGAQGGPPPDPLITFSANGITVGEVTSLGRVLLFGLTRETADYSTRVRRYDEIVTDSDGDRVVAFELETALPFRSVWVAMDLDSGGYAVAAPAGLQLRVVPWRGRGVVRNPGHVDSLETTGGLLELLVVRPGKQLAAWALTVGDGGGADVDGAEDGLIAAELSDFRPLLDSGTPPEHLLPTDIVAMVDPRTLEVSVVTAGVGPASAATAGAR
jgi:hypothetical protein